MFVSSGSSFADFTRAACAMMFFVAGRGDHAGRSGIVDEAEPEAEEKEEAASPPIVCHDRRLHPPSARIARRRKTRGCITSVSARALLATSTRRAPHHG